MASNYVGEFDQFGQNALRGANAQGFFDPGGSEAFRATARRRALLRGRSRRNRAALGARLFGMDQMGQRQALLDQDMDIADQQSNALNDFDFNEYGQNRDFFRGLLGERMNWERQRKLAEDERKAQEKGFWGQLGGAALGAIF